jgi:hypothetical protein
MAFGVACLSVSIVLLALQLFWAWRFALRYPPRPEPTSAERLPRATVLMSIRGPEPTMADCLNGLLHQDYPHYDVGIIVDSSDDPAWEIVSPLLRARTVQPTVKVSVLRDRQETCSLKVSALVQAIRELNASTEVVVLIDADVRPYRHWLRDLVRPLANPRVGATCGVRWYMPRGKASWGTVVRSLWNAVACTQMYVLNIPWAGSMAFRADVFRKSQLLDRWAQSFVEDTGSHRFLRSLGLRLCWVHEATMVSHDRIGLKDAYRFISRQLFNTRLYHESWPLLFTVGIGTSLALCGTVLAAVVGLLNGEPQLATATGIALAGYFLGMGLALSWADRQIDRLNQTHGANAYPYPWRTLLAGPLTQAVHLASLVSASFAHRIEWRGITYEVNGSGCVRLLEYRPYGRPVGSNGPAALASK